MASKQESMAALDEAIAAADEGAPTAAPELPDSVYCQVCATEIDAVTGAPLEPVGPEQVAAVQAAAGMADGPAPAPAPAPGPGGGLDIPVPGGGMPI